MNKNSNCMWLILLLLLIACKTDEVAEYHAMRRIDDWVFTSPSYIAEMVSHGSLYYEWKVVGFHAKVETEIIEERNLVLLETGRADVNFFVEVANGNFYHEGEIYRFKVHISEIKYTASNGKYNILSKEVR